MRMFPWIVLALLGLPSAGNAQSAQTPAAIPVGVVSAERKPVTKSLDFVGRVEAVQRVEIKARITALMGGAAMCRHLCCCFY